MASLGLFPTRISRISVSKGIREEIKGLGIPRPFLVDLLFLGYFSYALSYASAQAIECRDPHDFS